MYLCLCVCVCVFVCVCIMYVCIYICTYKYICVCAILCVRVCPRLLLCPWLLVKVRTYQLCCSICNNIHVQCSKWISMCNVESFAKNRCLSVDLLKVSRGSFAAQFAISMCNMNLQCRASSFAKNRWLVFRNSHMAASLLNLQYNLSGKLTS